ncbi:MAG: ribosome biogenesis GTPase Der [Coriobacteriia bacterium]|nr:ribosome biogenesis GTPase Der [Coriobacteriia bacterium]
MALPLVAVVGRPNVGKSTFVNRIAQSHDAIVHEQSGVTRDRSYHRADWNGREFMLVDTGGIELASDDAFGASIRAQAVRAAQEADAVVFLVDGRTGLAPGDEDVASLLRRGGKQVFLVVNKVDDPGNEAAIHDFWALGLGQPWPVSALHGHGTGDLLDAIVSVLPAEESEEESDAVDVAIIGRPNAGKSSLFNRLIGSERAIVSDVPGTTRDAIDTVVERDARRIRLIDTAGLRRKSQIDDSVEYFGFVRAMRAIDRASVALLVIDATVGVTDQDQRVARFAEERGCGLIVLLNKWDVVAGPESKDAVARQAAEKLAFVSYAPLFRISAKTGAGTDRIFDAVHAVSEAHARQVPTSQLNRLLTEIRASGHTVSKGRRRLKLAYATQTRIRPPEFTFFANHPDLVEPAYERYLENRLRETFDLTGTPIKLVFRRKG